MRTKFAITRPLEIFLQTIRAAHALQRGTVSSGERGDDYIALRALRVITQGWTLTTTQLVG